MTLLDKSLPESKQKFEFCNKSSHPIEVMVELIPERYILNSDDTMILIADITEKATRVEGYTVNVYDGGFQIYAAWDADPEVFINGQPAKPDWTTLINQTKEHDHTSY